MIDCPAWRRRLAGDDGPGRSALPVGELFDAMPLAAAALLAANDWLWKGSAAPALLTGKLSDVAGLALAPLVLTATFDSLLWLAARAGVAVDWTLGPRRLAAAIALTGAAFAAVKLSPAAAASLSGALGARAKIVADPSDLLALPALAAAAWQGRRELARVPIGRIEVALAAARRGEALAPLFGDVVRAGGDPLQVAALIDALDACARGGAAETDAAEGALLALRCGARPRSRSAATAARPRRPARRPSGRRQRARPRGD